MISLTGTEVIQIYDRMRAVREGVRKMQLGVTFHPADKKLALELLDNIDNSARETAIILGRNGEGRKEE